MRVAGCPCLSDAGAHPCACWPGPSPQSGPACGLPCRLHSPPPEAASSGAGWLPPPLPLRQVSFRLLVWAADTPHPHPRCVLTFGPCPLSLDAPCVPSMCRGACASSPCLVTDEDAGSRGGGSEVWPSRPSAPGSAITCLPPWWSALLLSRGPWPRALLPPDEGRTQPHGPCVSFSGAPQDSWVSEGTQDRAQGKRCARLCALGPGRVRAPCSGHRDRTRSGAWAGSGGLGGRLSAGSGRAAPRRARPCYGLGAAPRESPGVGSPRFLPASPLGSHAAGGCAVCRAARDPSPLSPLAEEHRPL